MRISDWSSDVCSSDLRLGRLDLGRIDQALVDAYARHLRDDPARRPVIVGQLLQVVTDLYHLRDHLPDGGLGFEPWAGRAAARVAGYRHVRAKDRKSVVEGKRVSVRVALGGRRIIKKKTKIK